MLVVMRLNLRLMVCRLHLTQSEPIKHMSIMSFLLRYNGILEAHLCYKCYVYGSTACRFDLNFSVNDPLWSAEKTIERIFLFHVWAFRESQQ